MGDRLTRQPHYLRMKYVEPDPLVEALLGTSFSELRETQGEVKAPAGTKNTTDPKDSEDDEARSNRPER